MSFLDIIRKRLLDKKKLLKDSIKYEPIKDPKMVIKTKTALEKSVILVKKLIKDHPEFNIKICKFDAANKEDFSYEEFLNGEHYCFPVAEVINGTNNKDNINKELEVLNKNFNDKRFYLYYYRRFGEFICLFNDGNSKNESGDTVMEREEFEVLLQEVFNAGYEQAELDCVNESNRETRARNRETTKREVKKRFEPIRFLDKDSDEKNQKTPTHLSSKDMYTKHQVHIKQTKGGRVQNVVSGDYGLSSVRSKNGKYATFDDNRVKENPKLDRTNYFKKLNDEIKNEKDLEVRKKKVTSAKKFLNELKEKRKKKIGYKAPVFYRTDDD